MLALWAGPTFALPVHPSLAFSVARLACVGHLSSPAQAFGSSPVQPGQPPVQGIWLFSRSPSNMEALETMLSYLEGLGVDTSVLLGVEHEDCEYNY
jgi:hypothetical protein